MFSWENYLNNPLTAHRFLSRILPATDQSDLGRIERKLAATRLFLTFACLAVTYLDPARPTGTNTLSFVWLSAYLVYSLLILLLLRLRPFGVSGEKENLGEGFGRIWRPVRTMIGWGPPVAGSRLFVAVHIGDLIAVTAFTVFTQGPHNAFYVFFIFVVLAAAYRWGFRECMATALAAGVLIFLENALFEESHLHRMWHLWTPLLPNFVMPALYLFLQGVVAGFLAIGIRKLHAEKSAIDRIAAGIDAEAGTSRILSKVCHEVLAIFGSRETLLAVRELETDRMHLWRARQRGTDVSLQLIHLEADSPEKYFFAAPDLSWCLLPPGRRRASSHVRLSLREGGGLYKDRCELPPAFETAHPLSSLLVATLMLGRDLSVRVFLPDPAPEMLGRSGLIFLHDLCARIGAAIHEVYRTNQARAEASRVERESIARELHDGVIQSLIAIEMQLHVLRVKCGADGTALGDKLARIHENLRHEILSLRMVMQRLKHLEFGSSQSIQALRSVARQFECEEGITVSFETGLEELRLAPSVSGELVRILQEALVNIRKHSKATLVSIRLERSNGYYLVAVQDNGIGFGFEGRLPLERLEAEGMGPAVIKERVRLIGADLEIESSAGKGSCLEIRIPTEHYEIR